jgi:DNA polymerase-4/DNA polymerase V
MFAYSSLPKAILHIDGDAFFASCEQSRRPELAGKPVVTGKERGIASSMSYEAKARGVTRGMPYFEIKKVCPEAVFLPSDYETYSLLSKRLYAIVRRYTNIVEEYGIDECFADITGLRRTHKMGYIQIAKKIKRELDAELGFTFSVGLAPSKVLAKIGSKWKKPSGLTTITTRDRWLFLDKYPAEKVWGIGPQTTAFLAKQKIFTAGDFARTNEWWIKNNLTKPFWEIWQELNGASVLPLAMEEKSSYYSIQKFKTFTPPAVDAEFIFSQLSKNIENACIKVRRHKLMAQNAFIILRTQDFHDRGAEIQFAKSTSRPDEIITACREVFYRLLRPGQQYRATGIVLTGLTPAVLQPDLFTSMAQVQKMVRLYEGVDEISAKYGKHTVFLGSSFQAQQFGAHQGERGDAPERAKNFLFGETGRQHINIPMLLAGV